MPSPPVAVLAVDPHRRRPTRSWCPDGPGQLAKLDHRRADRRVRRRSPVPRDRPPVRRRRRGDDRRRDPAARSSGPSRRRRCSRSPYRKGKTAHLDVERSAGRGDPQGGPRAARRRGRRARSHRAGRVGRIDADPDEGRRRGRSVPVRQALRDEPRPGGPLVQARADDPLRAPRGRELVPVGAAPVRVRGLHGAAAPPRRASRPRSRTGSSSSRRSASTCSSPSSSTAPSEIGEVDVDDQMIDEGLQIIRRLWDTGLAHRDIKPANLLVRRRPRAADRRRVRPGPSVAVAPGGRPRQHDAGARGPERSGAGLRAGPAVLHPRRHRRGVRRGPRGRQPEPAADDDEARRSRPDRTSSARSPPSVARSPSSGGASAGSSSRSRWSRRSGWRSRS